MSDSVRVAYQTIEFGEEDIHLRTLRDKQEYDDSSGEAEALGISSASWSLFGVIWDASKALARLMFEYDIGDRRVLEVGCGLGLASLVMSRRGVDITATDHHPEAGNFLRENCKLNDEPQIPFVRAGWTEESDELGRFDLIVGSDLLYEPDHAGQLAGFIDRHANETCEVIIIDPGRGNGPKFTREMEALGFENLPLAPASEESDEDFSGQFLRYVR